MAIHDTIGDFLTQIRNAKFARKASLTVRTSKMCFNLAHILKQTGYLDQVFEKDGQLTLVLRYREDAPGETVLTAIKRESKPGRRMYYPYDAIPKVLGGLGVAILTTSKGLLTDTEARQQKQGGELICTVW